MIYAIEVFKGRFSFESSIMATIVIKFFLIGGRRIFISKSFLNTFIVCHFILGYLVILSPN